MRKLFRKCCTKSCFAASVGVSSDARSKFFWGILFGRRNTESFRTLFGARQKSITERV
jgi:hypothetical protein